YPVDAIATELAEQPGHVARGRGVLAIAAAAAFEILVERRQLDHADPFLRATLGTGNRDDLGLGGLFLELDARAVQHDAHRRAVQRRLAGNHVQAHLGFLRTLRSEERRVGEEGHTWGSAE